MRNEIIYVVGGTNGVGKSALYKELIKDNIPYINADFVAKEIAGGKQPTNRQYEIAQQYCTAQIKNLMASGRSFAIENNMHEEFSFQWLKDTQQNEGYRVEFFYIGVANLEITTRRIEERMKNGDHFVPPDQVSDRYEKGMKLLQEHYSMPDQLTLIDNSEDHFPCYKLEKGQTVYQAENLPQWAKQFSDFIDAKKSLAQETAKNTDEVQKMNMESSKQSISPKTNQNKQEDKLVKKNRKNDPGKGPKL